MKLVAKWRSNASLISIEKDAHVLCIVLLNCPGGVEASHVFNKYDLESSGTKDVSCKILPFFQSVISTLSAYSRIYSGPNQNIFSRAVSKARKIFTEPTYKLHFSFSVIPDNSRSFIPNLQLLCTVLLGGFSKLGGTGAIIWLPQYHWSKMYRRLSPDRNFSPVHNPYEVNLVTATLGKYLFYLIQSYLLLSHMLIGVKITIIRTFEILVTQEINLYLDKGSYGWQ